MPCPSLLVRSVLSLSLLAGCVEQSSDLPSEEEVKAARADNVLTVAPAPRFPNGAVLSCPPGQGHGKLTYLGMDAESAEITPGKPFTVTHYYRVEEPISEGWRLFVHVESGDKHGHLNADHIPVGGKYPVPMWKKGEIVRDVHKISVPPAWGGGKVDIYTGIWKGKERFRVEGGNHDAENRVLGGSLPSQGTSAPAVSTGGSAGKRLVVRRLRPGTVITIDGKLDEPAWKEAASTGLFVNSMSGAPAEQAAEAKVLWDAQNLYVAFDFADKDVWSTLAKHDDKLWTQEAAELFIDADGDGKTYLEVQINPRGATFDSWLPAYRQNDNAFDVPMKTAVFVNGTVDNRGDVDKGWSAELQIPLAAARGPLQEMKNVPPRVGSEWRVNFFRMDLPAGKAQQASAWSPPLVGDFHALDKFGTLVFADENGNPVVEAPKAASGAMMPMAPGVSPRMLRPLSERSLMIQHKGKARDEDKGKAKDKP